MGSRFIAVSTITCATFGILGCHSLSPTTRPTTLPIRNASASEIRIDWPAAPRLLEGFDIGDVGSEWHVGDSVLLGVRSERGSRTTVRYLLVELVDGTDNQMRLSFDAQLSDSLRQTIHIAPPSRRTRLTVFDETGKPLTQSPGLVPDRLLNNGLFGMLASAQPTTAPATGPSTATVTVLRMRAVERTVLALMAIVQFSASKGSNGALSSMMRDVIDPPSLWSLLTRQPTLGINPGNARAEIAPFADRDWSAAVVGLDLSFNDDPILTVEAHAVESRPPIGLVSGIFKADGRHPTDAARSVHLQLLAARRGTGAAFRAYTIR